MGTYLLAIDQGTTSSRALIFDHQGKIVSQAQQEFQQYFPKAGWVEHDAMEIWETQLDVARKAIAALDAPPSEIEAIGITNQRETTVVWDRETGQPIHKAIVWQDRRTASYCDQLRSDGHADRIQQLTGLVPDAYFSGTKVRWILDHVEGARERAEAGELAFGTIDSWLVWNLTGGNQHITDVTNASRTLMFNIHTLEWDEELLELLQIPKSLLPEVRSCSEVFGSTADGIFGASIPIAGIAGDQQAALFGQLCDKPGMVKNTYGTGCFMLMNVGEEPVISDQNLLSTIAWQLGNKTVYALEGSVFMGGAIVQWLRDELKFIEKSRDIEALAGEVTDADGVYLVPAFSGLGAPYWNPYARGMLVGMTRGTGKAHIARAAQDSIAYQVQDLLKAMNLDSGIDIRELRVDGGATVNDTLMQFQSDLLQVPVIRPKVTETTALGAAYLAGLAVGFWKDLDALKALQEPDRSFEPKMDPEEVEKWTRGWNRAVKAAVAWAEDR